MQIISCILSIKIIDFHFLFHYKLHKRYVFKEKLNTHNTSMVGSVQMAREARPFDISDNQIQEWEFFKNYINSLFVFSIKYPYLLILKFKIQG